MHPVLPSQVLPTAKGWRAAITQRLGPLLRACHRRIVEPWLRRGAIKELQRLSARELRDVGIEPYEIDALVDDMLVKKRRRDGG